MDGQRGVALEWNGDEQWYAVRLDAANQVVGVRAECVQEHAFPVTEASVAAAVRLCQAALGRMLLGDVEGAIARLRGPDAPPLAWKHHSGIGRETWAACQFTLGTCYGERIVGRRGANLALATKHFQGCLEVYTHDAFPIQWAEVQNTLASAFAERTADNDGGDGSTLADFLGLAVHHYELSLEVFTRESFPTEWAMVSANLATALRDRAADLLLRPSGPGGQEGQIGGGDAAAKTAKAAAEEGLETAIGHYEAALEVFSEEAWPEQWGLIQNHLATAYSDRTVPPARQPQPQSATARYPPPGSRSPKQPQPQAAAAGPRQPGG